MTTRIIPGVYYEEIEDNVVSINQLPSGVVGIVGTADKGPLNTPTRITSWEQFIQVFGGWRDELTGPASYLSVRRQGVEEIYFSRIAGSTKAKAAQDFNQAGSVKATYTLPTRAGGAGVESTLTLQDDGATDLITITAIEAGVSEDSIQITITDGTSVGYSNVSIAKTGFNTETYSNVRVKTGDSRDLTALINNNSKLVTAVALADDETLANIAATPLAGGADSGLDSISITAKQAGTEGNSITVKVDHGDTAGRVNVLITDGTTSELFEDVYLDGVGNRNLVAIINATSSLVTAEQIATTGTGPDNNPHTQVATALVGGTAATVAFTLTAAEYGKYGDSLKVSITAAISGGYNIILVDATTNAVLETYTNVPFADVVTTINASSEYVVATAGTLAALEEVDSVYLAAGDNGATTVDSDYIGTVDANGNRTGLYALSGVDVITMQVAAQQSSTAINQANVSICESEGDRTAIISLPKDSTLAEVKTKAALTDSKITQQAWPWKVATHPVTGEDLVLAPAEFLAGTLCANKVNSSPSNKAILWAYRDYKEFGPNSNEMAELIQARVVPSARKKSTLDPTGRFVWMSGLTTTSSVHNKDKQISVIRPFLNIVEGIVEGLDPYVSENNTPYLRAAVRYSSKRYLEGYVKSGTLSSYSLKCDASNNTEEDSRNGYLYVDIDLYFTYPADFITLRVKRDPAGNIEAA